MGQNAGNPGISGIIGHKKNRTVSINKTVRLWLRERHCYFAPDPVPLFLQGLRLKQGGADMSPEIAFEFEANEEFVELSFPGGTAVHIDREGLKAD